MGSGKSNFWGSCCCLIILYSFCAFGYQLKLVVKHVCFLKSHGCRFCWIIFFTWDPKTFNNLPLTHMKIKTCGFSRLSWQQKGVKKQRKIMGGLSQIFSFAGKQAGYYKGVGQDRRILLPLVPEAQSSTKSRLVGRGAPAAPGTLPPCAQPRGWGALCSLESQEMFHTWSSGIFCNTAGSPNTTCSVIVVSRHPHTGFYRVCQMKIKVSTDLHLNSLGFCTSITPGWVNGYTPCHPGVHQLCSLTCI